MVLPFRCLDPQYRRELVRVYLTNVEGICRRFVEEKLEQLGRLAAHADGFRAFWLGCSPQQRAVLTSERADVILKVRGACALGPDAPTGLQTGCFMGAEAPVKLPCTGRAAGLQLLEAPRRTA